MTLQDSLLARLDRLAPVKEVAQIGAVIGRHFSYELLAAVVPVSEDHLTEALRRLTASGLISARGAPPQAMYAFKHALIQDAAYQSLLRSRRQQLHARIADVLERRFPEVREVRPELIAQHYTQAGLVLQAVHYWLKAGELALTRSAMTEAVAQLSRGLELLTGLSDERERRRLEIGLQIALGAAFTAAKGWASPEMGRAYARARDLCGEGSQTPELLAALAGLWSFHVNRAEHRMALEVAEQVLRVGEKQRNAVVLANGHRFVATSLMFLGQFDHAVAHFQETLDQTGLSGSKALALSGRLNPRVSSLSYVAWIRQFQGLFDEALSRSDESLTSAREMADPHLLAYAFHVNCLFRQVRGDWRAVHDMASALVPLARDHGFPHLLGTGTFFLNWAALRDGRFSAELGIAGMREGLAAKCATGAEIKVPYYLGVLAEALCQAGQRQEALALLADALARVERTDERWFEAELHRLRGETLLAAAPERTAEAEAFFRRALSVARNQGAALWELRASVSLACLLRSQGLWDQANELLGPICGRFNERDTTAGSDVPDLVRARALLILENACSGRGNVERLEIRLP